MEEDNSVYEVERVCFDYERSLKEGLFRLWENKYQPCYARMTSTSTSPSCRHSTQAPFPRCKFFSWLVRTERTRLIGRGEREWKPRFMGIKGKNERTKRTILNGCRGPWHDILEAAHGGWGIDSLRSKEIVEIVELLRRWCCGARVSGPEMSWFFNWLSIEFSQMTF